MVFKLVKRLLGDLFVAAARAAAAASILAVAATFTVPSAFFVSFTDTFRFGYTVIPQQAF